MALPITLFLATALLLSTTIHAAAESRKLDETTSDIPGSEKCTPCDPTPPPPSPPPPPALPPPKNPPSANCPPPPSPPSPSSIIYITGPPGNLYPVDDDLSGSRRTSVQMAAVIGCGILAAIALLGI